MRVLFRTATLATLILTSFPVNAQQNADPGLVVIKIRPFNVLGSDPPEDDVTPCNWSWSSGDAIRNIFRRQLQEYQLQGVVHISRYRHDHVVTLQLRSTSPSTQEAFRTRFQNRIKEQLQCAS